MNPIIDEFGNQRWYNCYGLLHRDNDKPAVIWNDGTKYWYQNDKRHRDNDKPAYINKNGDKYWYNKGKYRLLGYADKEIYTENNIYNKWLAMKLLKNGNSIRIIRLFRNLIQNFNIEK